MGNPRHHEVTIAKGRLLIHDHILLRNGQDELLALLFLIFFVMLEYYRNFAK